VRYKLGLKKQLHIDLCCVRYKLGLKKQLNIDCVLCEVQAEAEETVEHCVLCEVQAKAEETS
jgi:hypothetical protein